MCCMKDVATEKEHVIINDCNEFKRVFNKNKNSIWIEENNLSEVGNHIQTAINLDNYFVIIYDNKYLKNNETVIFK